MLRLHVTRGKSVLADVKVKVGESEIRRAGSDCGEVVEGAIPASAFWEAGQNDLAVVLASSRRFLSRLEFRKLLEIHRELGDKIRRGGIKPIHRRDLERYEGLLSRNLVSLEKQELSKDLLYDLKKWLTALLEGGEDSELR